MAFNHIASSPDYPSFKHQKQLQSPKIDISKVKLFVASAGNHFMIEIAQIFAEGFKQNKVATELIFDRIPTVETNPEEIQIIVAPHEFYPLFLESTISDPQTLEKITNNVFLLNVEQPGSSWYELAYQPAKHARGVFDINQQGVNEFKKRGIPVFHVPLGYEASCFEAKSSEDGDRSKPIDLLFLGSYSPKRELFLSKNANLLNRYKSHIVITRIEKPNSHNTPGFYSEERRNQLLRSSKILINIHSADRTYFEWHRVLLAMGNQCLVISENSDCIEPLINGQHLIITDLDKIPLAWEYYLEREHERLELVNSAYKLVTQDYTSKIICQSLLAQLNRSQFY